MAEITAVAGQPFTTYLEGAPEGIENWQVRIYDTTDVVVSGPAIDDFDTLTEGVTETEVNPEEVIYDVELPAPIPATGYTPDGEGRYIYTVAWMSDGEESEPDTLFVTLAVSFATLDDLRTLLGGAALTAEQTTQAVMLLPMVSGLIIDAVGRDDAWALSLVPVPPLIRAVCLTVVKRFMDNPSGARSHSETLGQHSYAASYTDGAHGLLLTDAEVMLCRRAVIGATSGSAYVDSLATVVAPATTLVELTEASVDDPPIYDWTD